MKKWLSVLSILLLGVGCSATPVPSPAKGEFSFSVRWPARVQTIPQETELIRVRITKGGAPRAELYFSRPADPGSITKQTVSLNAESGLSVRADAYTDMVGEGTSIASALVENLTVIPNQRVPVLLNLVPVN